MKGNDTIWLTWMQNFLSFWVTGTEGTVEFKVIDVVEEWASDGEENVLEIKWLFLVS